MTFATITNLVASILCAAVVLQSLRMKRSLRDLKSDTFSDTVKALDQATGQARTVLAELKAVLSTDGAANARTIASGESLRDELSLMVGIGNAVADRIMEAAAAVERRKDETGQRHPDALASADGAGHGDDAKTTNTQMPARPRRKRASASKVIAPAPARLQ